HRQSDPSWFGFLIQVHESAPFSRNDLTEHLEAHGIQTRSLFAGNLTRHPCFDSLVAGRDYRLATPLPQTDAIMQQAFWIGLYPGMSEAKIDYMTDVISDFIASR
ncbi:MAG TPA: DegT/DnrJ/EryC1/StrS family aminotransferase, partial [Lentisphaeria bacterium]|nr:DegT/DnrJ/EryC1/StrS family aminotransferase [Lentisphaeria bacterium]